MSCLHEMVEINATVADTQNKDKVTHFSMEACEHCLTTHGKVLEVITTRYDIDVYPYTVSSEHKTKRPATRTDVISLLSQIYTDDFHVKNWSYDGAKDWSAMLRTALKFAILEP